MDIRLIADGEEELCNNLHNRIYKQNRTIQQWKWGFVLNNYNRTPIPYAVVEDRGKIVGTQAFIPIRMIDKDGIYWTAKSEATLIDPDYRGKQLLAKMYALLFDYARENEFAYIWGFTSAIPAIKTLSRLGFAIPGKAEQIFMPFSNRSIPVVMSKNLSAKTDGVINKLKIPLVRSGCLLAQTLSSLKVALSKKRMINDFEMRTLDRPDKQTGELCRRFVKKWGGTTIYRDPEYLRWRLFENPYIKSVVRALYDQDELLGWTAFTLADDGMGYLVDLIIAGDHSRYAIEDLIRALLLEAVIGTRNMGATGIRGWRVNDYPFDSLIYRIAKKIGFYYIKRGSTAVLYNCDAGMKRASYNKFDDWFVTRIFAEGVLG